VHNKRLEAFRNNPGGDWEPADFEITASQYAMKFRKVTGTQWNGFSFFGLAVCKEARRGSE